jgi:hypothetical protein
LSWGCAVMVSIRVFSTLFVCTDALYVHYNFQWKKKRMRRLKRKRRKMRQRSK